MRYPHALLLSTAAYIQKVEHHVLCVHPPPPPFSSPWYTHGRATGRFFPQVLGHCGGGTIPGFPVSLELLDHTMKEVHHSCWLWEGCLEHRIIYKIKTSDLAFETPHPLLGGWRQWFRCYIQHVQNEVIWLKCFQYIVFTNTSKHGKNPSKPNQVNLRDVY